MIAPSQALFIFIFAFDRFTHLTQSICEKPVNAFFLQMKEFVFTSKEEFDGIPFIMTMSPFLKKKSIVHSFFENAVNSPQTRRKSRTRNDIDNVVYNKV